MSLYDKVFHDDTLKIYWVGPRESDIGAIRHLFAGSITLFGDNQTDGDYVNYAFCHQGNHPERIDHNKATDDGDTFMANIARDLLSKDPAHTKFMFYNGNAFHGIPLFADLAKEYAAYQPFLCCNDKKLMHDLNDKNWFHSTFERMTSVLPIINCNLTNCHYSAIVDKMRAAGIPVQEGKTRFIFQAPVASGGSGTFVLDSTNEDEIRKMIDTDANFLVSVYQENNVSVNLHAVIYDKDILLLPGSIQLMREGNMRLLYRGADFIAYREIDEDLRERFEEAAIMACRRFQEEGYRGVCGIDAIFAQGNMYLLEVNNRFQASTNLLNLALVAAGLKSVQELNVDAFKPNSAPEAGDAASHDVVVDYSNFCFMANKSIKHSLAFLPRAQADTKYVFNIDLDGFNSEFGADPRHNYTPDAHLYRVNFHTNISWVNHDGTVNIHENVAEQDYKWMDSIREFDKSEDNLLKLKISLLMQGVVFTPAGEVYRDEIDVREATNNAIDMRISNLLATTLSPRSTGEKGSFLLTVNSPTNIKMVEFTPFSLDIKEVATEGGTCTMPFLRYYGEPLMIVRLNKKDPYSDLMTSGGVPYGKVGFLSTDRLRVHVTNACKFKAQNVGCRFCNMAEDYQEIMPNDIAEVVKHYSMHDNEIGLNHYLVGGQSERDECAVQKIISTIQIVAKYAPGKDIYAMILPVSDDAIRQMRDAGLKKVAYNIEIFDEELAKKYMPGKGCIPREEYFRALAEATSLFDKAGETRSLVVVGLESHESMMRGIQRLADLRVQPILSIFRPMPETPLADIVPPSMRYIDTLYHEVTEMLRRINMHLGPSCIPCQNNTLSMPYTCGKDER